MKLYKIDHILEHKTDLNEYGNNGITSCILSYYNRLKLGINREKLQKNKLIEIKQHNVE